MQGPEILAECRALRAERYTNGLPTGEAVATTAGRLPARRVIHTVGPVWAGGDHREAKLLAAAYRNSLEIARVEGLRTVAFPAISTGVYGYPKGEAARIALESAFGVVRAHPDAFDELRFVLFSSADLELYQSTLGSLCTGEGGR